MLKFDDQHNDLLRGPKRIKIDNQPYVNNKIFGLGIYKFEGARKWNNRTILTTGQA